MTSPKTFASLKNIRSYKRISILLIALSVCAATFFYIRSQAATTYTWNQTGTASWATSSNWTPTRTTPAVDDILIFNNGATTTVTNVPTQTIGQLLVSGNTTVNLQANAASTVLAIGGGAGTDLSVASGSALNSNGTNSIQISVATGATGSVSGTMTYSAAVDTLIAADASGITFNSGSTFTQGTGCTGSVFTTTGTANVIVFASNSIFISQAGSNPFGLGQPNSKVVFQTGSLYKHAQTGSPAFSGRTYANFELNSATANISGTGGNALSINDLTITAGTLNLGMTGTFNLNGNVSVASSATLNFNPASASTLTLNGSTAQTISNSGTLTFQTNQNVTIANTSGVTVNSAVTFPGTTTINASTKLAAGASVT